MRSDLEALGCAVSIAPMLRVELLPIKIGDIGQTSGLIVTSRNAIASIAAAGLVAQLEGRVVFAVGPGTAAAAHEAGFSNVVTGPGNASQLCDLIVEKYRHHFGSPDQVQLHYISGEDIAYDCQAHLNAAGFDVCRVVAYRTVPAVDFPSGIEQSIQQGEVDGVILMSPRVACQFFALMKQKGLTIPTKRIRFFCLSEKVAAALPAERAKQAEIAQKPNSEEMLALIARFAPKC